MEHVRKQGVTNVREVEDVLLAHLGLVPTLVRPGRPMSVRLDATLGPCVQPWDLDQRLCARLKIDVSELDGWLAAQHTMLDQQLQLLAWQSCSWFKMASTLSDDTAPSASLDHLEAQAAPMQPRAQPEPLGGLPWPQEPGSGRPKVEGLPL